MVGGQKRFLFYVTYTEKKNGMGQSATWTCLRHKNLNQTPGGRKEERKKKV